MTYEEAIEKMAQAANPECWQPELMKIYDDLWMREQRDKERKKARAALAALRDAGFTVVPVEPTEAMLEASAIKWTSLCSGYPPESGHYKFMRGLYAAMIAAAATTEAKNPG